MTVITRAVRYRYLANDAVRVTLDGPWTGQCRLAHFPFRIRNRLDVTSTLMVGPLERMKLVAARDLGPDAYEAVRDDVACVRATLRLSMEGDLRDPLLPQALLLWGDDARREAELTHGSFERRISRARRGRDREP